MTKTLTLSVETKRTPLVAKAGEILRREFRERGGIELAEHSPASGADLADLALGIKPGIGQEGFRIEAGPQAGKRITGNDERGLLYGVGKYLRGCTFGESADSFRHSPWTGVSVPRRPVRGMYFATHFHNFYHDAPIQEVTRYVEELALWGCNALSVWFDMHHFAGIQDPAAQSMIRRLRGILEAANAVGMGAGLTALSNEGYANSPEPLRADWTAGHDGYTSPPGGHYHVELCPSKAGGMEQILKDRQEMLAAFADLEIEYVWNWPYDQGGCTCGKCAPWGANGFLKIARPYAEAVHRILPHAKVVLSTWYFDHFTSGEWEGLARALGSRKPTFADYLMVDDYGEKFPEYPLRHGVPGGLPMLNFPEISMFDMFPWGGYGANPLPRHLQRIWEVAGDRVVGGFPYSEGIFEDLNKAISLQHYWGDRDAMDTVGEYAAAVASPATANDLTRAIELMEEDHGHGIPAPWTGSGYNMAEIAKKLKSPENTAVLFATPKLKRAEECADLVRQIDARLTAAARQSWRWRQLRIRAEADAELSRAGGQLTLALDARLEELVAIYHAQQAELAVCPPSRSSLLRCWCGR